MTTTTTATTPVPAEVTLRYVSRVLAAADRLRPDPAAPAPGSWPAYLDALAGAAQEVIGYLSADGRLG